MSHYLRANPFRRSEAAEKRKRVFALWAEGGRTKAEVAREAGVHLASVYGWLNGAK